MPDPVQNSSSSGIGKYITAYTNAEAAKIKVPEFTPDAEVSAKLQSIFDKANTSRNDKVLTQVEYQNLYNNTSLAQGKGEYTTISGYDLEQGISFKDFELAATRDVSRQVSDLTKDFKLSKQDVKQAVLDALSDLEAKMDRKKSQINNSFEIGKKEAGKLAANLKKVPEGVTDVNLNNVIFTTADFQTSAAQNQIGNFSAQLVLADALASNNGTLTGTQVARIFSGYVGDKVERGENKATDVAKRLNRSPDKLDNFNLRANDVITRYEATSGAGLTEAQKNTGTAKVLLDAITAKGSALNKNEAIFSFAGFDKDRIATAKDETNELTRVLQKSGNSNSDRVLFTSQDIKDSIEKSKGTPLGGTLNTRYNSLLNSIRSKGSALSGTEVNVILAGYSLNQFRSGKEGAEKFLDNIDKKLNRTPREVPPINLDNVSFSAKDIETAFSEQPNNKTAQILLEKIAETGRNLSGSQVAGVLGMAS
jgi:hypothetical protein